MKVIVFKATWCGPCKAYAPIIEEVATELAVDIEHVDVDANMELAKEHNIMGVPTTIIVNDNNDVLFSQTGALPKDKLKSAIIEAMR